MQRILLALLSVGLLAQAPPPAPSVKVSPEDLAALREGVKPLSAKLAKLQGNPRYADVAVYEKAVSNLLRYPDEFYSPDYVRFAKEALAEGLSRADALAAGNAPWAKATGRVYRGYQSRVDDSVQPYRLNIPAGYDGSKPVRLDLVLHGRNARLTEASFLAVDPKAKPYTQDWIELEVYGRGNNAYRWSGETDVFEALEDAMRQYKIDPDRVVLRGFSMGGAGAWHLGLHHPSRWAGVEAGAGFTETIVYAKRDNPSAWERAAMRIYDSVDYSPNITNVPTVGYGGEIDKQLQASVNIRLALEAAGVRSNSLFLVGPGTEHKWHPDSKAESEAFLAKNLPRKAPETFQFVTFSPRFGRIWNWKITALETMYARAELKGTATKVTTANIAELELDAPAKVVIDGQALEGKAFVKQMNRWEVRPSKPALRKRAGLQGPIDDAFLDRFLSVAPTETPAFTTFRANFEKYFRGEIRTKSAKAVTKADMAESHLVLWGTPETNELMGKIVKKLPVKWTKTEIAIGGRSYDAAKHTLALIQPNPLSPAKYVVFNAGHSFGKADLVGTNALLYPRWGDWAVLETATGKLVAAGFFNDFWQ